MDFKFCSDHDNPTDSQVIICLTGTAAYIREKLDRLSDEANNPKYGKPIQGQSLWAEGKAEVHTPVWEGIKY